MSTDNKTLVQSYVEEIWRTGNTQLIDQHLAAHSGDCALLPGGGLLHSSCWQRPIAL